MILAHVLQVALPRSDILHDLSTLTLIGDAMIIISIIAIVGVGIYQVRKTRTQRKIAYRIISDAPIVNANRAVVSRVQILLNGQPVQDAHLAVLRMWNAGEIAVKNENYFEPLTFIFETEVFNSDIVRTDPPDLIDLSDGHPFLTVEPQSVLFPRFPLNPHNSIIFAVLLRGKSSVKVKGRIEEGIIEEDLRTGEMLRKLDFVPLNLMPLSLGIIFIALFGTTLNSSQSPINIVLSIISLILGIGSICVYVIKTGSRKY